MEDQKRVYICGGLTGLPAKDERRVKEFYELIGSGCSEEGWKTHIPHQHSDPVAHPDLEVGHVYRTDKYQVRKATVLVLVLIPDPRQGPEETERHIFGSLGSGIELGWADEWGTPIIGLCPEGYRLSRLVKEIPLSKLFHYKNPEHAKLLVKLALKEVLAAK